MLDSSRENGFTFTVEMYRDYVVKRTRNETLAGTEAEACKRLGTFLGYDRGG